MKHKHLFILCPPASGSTLLWQILRTSPQVASLPGEGQALAREILFNRQRWDPRMPVDWEQVRKAWEEAWDMSKPVLLEKSPPHLVRARQLEAFFPESHFVVMMRNPYAFCEGIKRRWKSDWSYAAIARFWIDWAGHQLANLRQLRRTLSIRYEDLTADPQEHCRRLVSFIPELVELHAEAEFRVFEKTQKIENLNPRQIARLTRGDILEINSVLKDNPELLKGFQYCFLNDPA